jgi:MFS superfamily sulfate permease-like transporter
MNTGQKRLFDKENYLRAKYGKVRLKLLKARQIGFTTYKTIDKLDKALTTKNCTVNIVAHKQDKLQDIFMKVKYTFDRIPDIIELED